ncbi:restriction endonuclease subunit S [Hydrogenophaga sp. NH-16]|uniref:restriction endonuclease subunit S n=1 Tax=Hydrogenophaga sp. NH-16 TaxID=2184519 RepID=UPI000FD7B57E|nr:restriction endonuclease subunit S [Hydrogenophaga sp. NH-16]
MKYPAYPDYRPVHSPALKQLPAHWQLKRLRFATTGIEQGWSPQCDNEVADDDRWGVMKVGCVNGDRFDPLENKALPADLDPMPAYELQPGDVLVSRANTKELVGSAAVVPDGVRPRLLLCDKLFRIRPQAEVHARFLTYVLRTPAARYQYERDATGASGSMQNIGQDTIKNLSIPLPSTDEQAAITDFLDWRTAQIDALIAKKQALLERLSERRLALVTTQTLETQGGRNSRGTHQHGQFGIPSHWSWHRLKFTALEPLKYGANEPADMVDPVCPRYIRITDIRDDGTLHDDRRLFTCTPCARRSRRSSSSTCSRTTSPTRRITGWCRWAKTTRM